MLGLEAIWSIYISVAHWRYRLGRGIYYKGCRLAVTAILVVDCSEENLLFLLQRFILRIYHTEGNITRSPSRKCTKMGLIYLYLI